MDVNILLLLRNKNLQVLYCAYFASAAIDKDSFVQFYPSAKLLSILEEIESIWGIFDLLLNGTYMIRKDNRTEMSGMGWESQYFFGTYN